MAEIVPINEAHVREIDPNGAPKTLYGLAVVEDGHVLGLTGFYTLMGNLVLIAEIRPEVRADMTHKRRRLLLAAARAVMTLALTRKMPLLAVADPAIEGSAVLLTHLGFVHEHKETYKWPGSR